MLPVFSQKLYDIDRNIQGFAVIFFSHKLRLKHHEPGL